MCRQQQPLRQTMKISDVKSRLSSVVNAVYRKETRILIERAGIPVAALISADDLARLDALDRAWDANTRAMERISAKFADIPTEELEERIDEIVAAGREQDKIEAIRQSA
jgi:prevent-host-death family protein